VPAGPKLAGPKSDLSAGRASRVRRSTQAKPETTR
jgi:hypothetical protein